MWRASLPALVGGLVLLYVVQAPLAYRMAVRLRAAQDERERLLVSSLAAADRDRGRPARRGRAGAGGGELHPGRGGGRREGAAGRHAAPHRGRPAPLGASCGA